MIDQANELRQLMRQQAEIPAAASCAGPRLITVAGGKGGVGTTTVAIHLAVALARQSERVLLVDADPDRADVATLCGLPAVADLADLAVARQPLDKVVIPGPEGVFVIPGAQRAARYESSVDRFHQRWIQQVRESETPFDYVIADAGNGSSHSVAWLWEAAEMVLLVTTAGLPSILDTYASIKTLSDTAAPPAIHTLVNQVSEPSVAYDVHGRLARAVWRFLGFQLESAGHIAWTAATGDGEEALQPPRADSQSQWAREFGQLARVVRASLHESARRSTAAPLARADRNDDSPAAGTAGNQDTELLCQLAADGGK